MHHPTGEMSSRKVFGPNREDESVSWALLLALGVLA
jgi:hypothetical protein